jgi:pimeloyl-ACP methyl ester carboxylesterase
MSVALNLKVLALIGALLLCAPLHADPLRKRIEAAAAVSATTTTSTTRAEARSGTLLRALDPTGAVPGTISIYFEFYPQSKPSLPNVGTIVASEGGPGYPSTASRGAYLALFDPLRDDRHLLMVDNRGTGRSAAIRCPELQVDAFYTPQSVAACGAQLGSHAALFGSALAADDLAAVLDALHISTIDLYGDSYGTFFAQTFAGRHPSRLRSVVLDAAYAVTGADPWYPEAAPQARAAFDTACVQSPACAAQPGSSMGRIHALLDSLRSHPVSGSAPDGNGTMQSVTANARGLAYVMLSNASGPVVYRELDAAARAWAEGDTPPLLRLVAENQTVAVSGGGSARAFSAGLFTAVSCADYPQIYRMTDLPEARHQQASTAIAVKKAREPTVYAPFTIEEFLSMPQDYSVLNLCLPWQVPSAGYPPGQPVPPGAAFADVPVLVLSGEMDSLTPPAQGAQAAALFPQARHVRLRNSFHVAALGDMDQCASTLVRQFVKTLTPGDSACAAAVPAYPLVSTFARHSHQLSAATPGHGNQGTADDLRLVASALGAAGDAIARWWVNDEGSGVGLRGGSFSYSSSAEVIRFELDAMRFTEDLPVSGSLSWHMPSNAVRASLSMPGGTLEAHWPARGSGARATIRGRLNGRLIVATAAAP